MKLVPEELKWNKLTTKGSGNTGVYENIVQIIILMIKYNIYIYL